jgi:tetratricopeptide (TPR) repeat protein
MLATLERDDGAEEGEKEGDVVRAEAHGLAGVASRAIGAISTARRHFDESERLFSRAASRESDLTLSLALAATLEDRAELELDARAPDSARIALRRAVSLTEAAGASVRGETWLALADCELRCGAPEAACDALERALGDDDDPELALDPHDRAVALELRGAALLARGEPEQLAAADASFAASETAFRAASDLPGTARALLGRAHVAERRGDVVALGAHAAALRALPLDGAERERIEAELTSIE